MYVVADVDVDSGWNSVLFNKRKSFFNNDSTTIPHTHTHTLDHAIPISYHTVSSAPKSIRNFAPPLV